VAIRCDDGFVDEVVKVDGDDAYRIMMRRIHNATASRGDITVLGEMMAKLQAKAEEHLGHKIFEAASIVEDESGFTDDEICHAMQHAGLDCLSIDMSEFHAAYAGNKLGLCNHYAHHEACLEEERNMQLQNVFSVTFTNYSLSGTLGLLTSSNKGRVGNSFHCDTCGLDTLRLFNNSEEYWEVVRNLLLDLPLAQSPLREIDVVILNGESASDEMFVNVLSDVIQDIQRSKPRLFADHALYTVARGAAEMAKRAKATNSRDGGGMTHFRRPGKFDNHDGEI
jgi:hypothetical protein